MAPQVLALPVHGAFVITIPRHHDHRGHFNEFFNSNHYPEVIRGSLGGDWRQASVSFTKNVNTIRGLHLSPYNKFCTVLSGAVYDVMVDMREDSPTFLKWCGVHLTEENRKQVHVPAKCAHGFLTLAPNSRMFYLQGGTFDPANEADIYPFDQLLNVHWPLLVESGDAILSQKDKSAPCVVHSSRRPHLARMPSMPRVLIVGATGQVGSALAREYSANGWMVYGTHTKKAQPGEHTFPFDLAAAGKDQSVADALIDTMYPDVIILCAGFTWVDGCEDSPEQARILNADGPIALATAARRIGAKFVNYSTDYVWDGTKGPYSEEDPATPMSVYGKTKLAMEEAILALQSRALLLRTCVVYGPEKQGKNFVYQLARKLTAGEELKVMSDQVSTPTYNRDLATLTRLLCDVDAIGVYNAGGKETCSRYDFAVAVANQLDLDASLIKPGLTKDAAQKAPRPLAAGMKSDKALRLLAGKYQPLSIEESIADWLRNPAFGDIPLQAQAGASRL